MGLTLAISRRILFPLPRNTARYTLGTLFLPLLGALPTSASPVDEIFVSVNNGGYVPGYVSEYTTGSVLNPMLISNLDLPISLAVSGNSLFVAGAYNAISIAEFTTGGALVNPFLISISEPVVCCPYSVAGVTVSGSDLFAASTNGTISEYTTSGALVNAALVSGLSIEPGLPAGIAVSGSDLFVTNYGDATIGEYTTSGTTVNASLIFPLQAIGIVAVGSDLFIVNQTGTISEYTTSGAFVASSFAGITGAEAIATDGSNLFVSYQAGSFGTTITGEYTTSGAALNASLFTVAVPPGFPSIAVAPLPEPSTLLLVPAGLLAVAVRIARRRRP
jgi:hypothetical protein